MASSSSKRDREHALSRRALIRWSLGAGAALGLGRSGILDVLERAAGPGVAHAAAAVTTRRSLHIRAGTGGLAWFQLLWPHNDIAAARTAGMARLAFHAPGEQQVIQTGPTRRLTLGPEAPWAALAAERQVTAIMAGRNEAHVNNPDSIVRALDGSSLFAIAAAMQTTNPCLVPVITVDDVELGGAPGAPSPAVVPTGADIVGLFNSAASRVGGLLRDATHAEVYRAHSAALAGLNRAAQRPTTAGAYATGRSAAGFVSVNLAEQLAIRPADEALYRLAEIDPRCPDIVELGRTLIVAVKAFAMGLTQSVVLPGPRDDPHGAFTDLGLTRAKLAALQLVLDGFLADLASRRDDVTGTPLDQDIVVTIEGDTPKTPLDSDQWPDDTPANSNWIYVLGAGALVTGWFGGIAADGAVTGFDPATGAPSPPDRGLQARAAVAAVAHAIARGDTRRVADFTRGLDYSGLVA